MPSDSELLRRYVAQQSEAAFADLVRRHLPMVYSSAFRQVNGDIHLAEDITQTVFTSLARKASSLIVHASLAGWLYLSTHHAAAQAVRTNRRRQAREEKAHAMHDTSSSTDWDRIRPVLDEALRGLGTIDREAVLLRYFEKLPFADIGATLNLSEDAARMRVERALARLQSWLANRGITSTTSALAAVFANQAVAAPAGLAASITGSALASSAAVAGGFFSNLSTTLFRAVTAIAIGVGIYHVKQTQRAEAATAAAVQERDMLRGQLRDAERLALQAKQQLAVVQQQAAAAVGSKAAPLSPQGSEPKSPVIAARAGGPEGEIGSARNIGNTLESRRAALSDAIDSV